MLWDPPIRGSERRDQQGTGSGAGAGVGVGSPRGSLAGALADRFLTGSPQPAVDPAFAAARAAAQSDRDRRELIGVLCGQYAPKVEKVVDFVTNDSLGQQTGQAIAAVGVVSLGAYLISRLF